MPAVEHFCRELQLSLGAARHGFAIVLLAALACGGSESAPAQGTVEDGGNEGSGGNAGNTGGTAGDTVGTTTGGIACPDASARTGQGGARADSGPVCPPLPSCLGGDASTCPPSQSGTSHCGGANDQQCCVHNGITDVCYECSCDFDCPSSAPFCSGHTCIVCRSNCDCPAGRQCKRFGNDSVVSAYCD